MLGLPIRSRRSRTNGTIYKSDENSKMIHAINDGYEAIAKRYMFSDCCASLDECNKSQGSWPAMYANNSTNLEGIMLYWMLIKKQENYSEAPPPVEQQPTMACRSCACFGSSTNTSVRVNVSVCSPMSAVYITFE